MRFLALLLKNEQVLMYDFTSSRSAFARLTGLGKASKRAGLMILTRLSVHCAESMTAMSSS